MTAKEWAKWFKANDVSIVYIASPTSRCLENTRVFHTLAARLCRAGVYVINPAKKFRGNTTLAGASDTRLAIHYVLEADAVIAMDGWRDCDRETLAMAIAQLLGMPVAMANGFVLQGEDDA